MPWPLTGAGRQGLRQGPGRGSGRGSGGGGCRGSDSSGRLPGVSARPLTRLSREACVRVLKLATNTERTPSTTGIPACVTSPPKISAVPGAGVSTVSGRLWILALVPPPAQKPVPPPAKSPGAVSGMSTVSARWSLCAKVAIRRVDVDGGLPFRPLKLASLAKLAQRWRGVGEVKRRRRGGLHALRVERLPRRPLVARLEKRLVDRGELRVHHVEHAQQNLLDSGATFGSSSPTGIRVLPVASEWA